ncbi:ATP-binding cassette domain-containing protein [Staphylococcus epidermidis]|uniref:ABC transporter ATP-binding protein n=1 Tax=Staphylococcus epidermidis TaxID=1282 RepID=UPI0018871638|nr:ATP-binding cassette domain-containing protein [Staphylococcus epidermidis]MBF2337479.1 ATP-binding cassette domain-containing protein [Staphylococcus epidermidis]MCG1333279.1 ATP-binding cassette domain-containing protein [Staphylococcus epidermidis]UII02940.1 NukF [Staphylococcus epidermidis]
MVNNIVQTTNLTKKFSDNYSVKDLSINIGEQEIYGFLGPNGAGKSTTMKMLLGLVKPTNGNIKIFNQDVLKNRDEILMHVGSLIEEPSYYKNLTGLENLQIIQRLLNLPSKNIDKALKIVRLTEHKNKLVKNYSLGMKQRLGIALAIVKFPKLLILDEPTNGLDPAGIQEIRELIKSFPEEYGMTVLISSHLLSEIEHMASTVGIINRGELLFEGNLSELEEQNKVLINTNNNEESINFLQSKGYTLEPNDNPILLDTTKKDISTAVRLLVNNQFEVYQVQSVKRNLEEKFIEMTNDGKEYL